MRYLKASFMNVPFFIEASSMDAGRRWTTHVFIGVDNTEHESDGMNDPLFTIDGYLVGDNADIERDNFEKVLNSGDSGYLIHPWRGPINCVCLKYTVRETNSEFKLIRYSITFERQHTNQKAPVVVDTRKATIDASISFNTETKKAFSYKMSQLDMLKANINNLRAAIDKFFDVVRNVRNAASSLAVVRQTLENARGKIIELSLSSDYLGDVVDDLISLGNELASGEFFTIDVGRSQLNEQREIMTSMYEMSLTTNDTAVKEMADMAYLISLSAFCALLTKTNFEINSEVQENILFVLSEIDKRSNDADIEDDSFYALRVLRQTVFDDLRTRLLATKRTKQFILMQQETSLSLCYELNGSLDYEQFIIDANNIEHPLFVPAAIELIAKVDV